jgi:hypothetical protein
MPTNVFFSRGVTAEQSLYEDIVVESLKIYGQDLYYIPRVIVRDGLLNDVVTSSFSDAYAIEMYISNTDGFEGDQTIMSKFGLEIRDQATFVVARRSWEKFVGLYNNDVNSIRPLEGDLLYYPPTRSFFEIKFVEHERPFYQLNNLVVYELQCELFEYSDERFETGRAEIDAIQTYNATSIVAEIRDPVITSNARADELYIGEQVAQGLAGGVFIFAEITNLGVTAEGVKLIYLSNITTSDGLYHELQEDVRITGQTSLITYNLFKLYDLDDQDVNYTFPNNENAQNWEFETRADDLIDFSENNPFGDPSIKFGQNTLPLVDNPTSARGLFVVSSTLTFVDTTLIKVDKE